MLSLHAQVQRPAKDALFYNPHLLLGNRLVNPKNQAGLLSKGKQNFSYFLLTDCSNGELIRNSKAVL